MLFRSIVPWSSRGCKHLVIFYLTVGLKGYRSSARVVALLGILHVAGAHAPQPQIPAPNSSVLAKLGTQNVICRSRLGKVMASFSFFEFAGVYWLLGVRRMDAWIAIEWSGNVEDFVNYQRDREESGKGTLERSPSVSYCTDCTCWDSCSWGILWENGVLYNMSYS